MWERLAFVLEKDYTSMEEFDAATGSLWDRRNQVGLCVEAANRDHRKRPTKADEAAAPSRNVRAASRLVLKMLCTATPTVPTIEVW